MQALNHHNVFQNFAAALLPLAARGQFENSGNQLLLVTTKWTINLFSHLTDPQIEQRREKWR